MMPWSPAPSSLLVRLQRVDAGCNIGRLRMQQHLDIALVPVEAFLLVADVADGLAGDVCDPVLGDRVGPARLARDDDAVGGSQRLAGGADGPRIDAGLRPLAIEQIDDLVGDAVAHLVGMAFGDRLAGEEKGFARHSGPRAFSPLRKNAGVVSSFGNGVKHGGTVKAAARHAPAAPERQYSQRRSLSRGPIRSRPRRQTSARAPRSSGAHVHQ